ncbi:HD-GYP domain-containing protein [Clostridium formicaceticum]|uniref:Cyclic di-GMP phosphodiesterase response regulator RpfG n=1 Tax=Clostridium formicaceticum TaxID=1497 RepID=A0AAC9RTF7_9CLOT|nr:HD-GYP domain-containing protein [Clostridium formicaceticum]AOY75174.1 hypothetical protein BJL90_04200 [Clostridium formicaceticum]ARE89600.1 Cyclic di-GMP phosphodiesterase response regulator RpfG [Clostridium formicaceticum]
MRYIPIEYAREGDFLAQPLFNEQGLILLSKGVKLTEGLIGKIKKQGYYSLYILDNISDQEVQDVIKPEIRQKAAAVMRKVIHAMPTDGKMSSDKIKATSESMKELTALMEVIVDEVFTQKDLVMNLVDIRNIDNYTYAHSVNVMLHALLLGISVALNRNELYDLSIGATVHDIGKVFVPESILKKPGALTGEEFQIMQQHTTKGFNFLREYTSFSATARIVSLQHQERIDGSGYPANLKDKDIHFYSKITAIADVYDALTSDRHYRRALPAKEAIEYIMGASGRFFDKKLVKSFILKVNPYPIGTLVRLSNGYEGVVEEVNEHAYFRPVVKIVTEGGKKVAPWLCNLLKEYALVIEETIYKLSG